MTMAVDDAPARAASPPGGGEISSAPSVRLRRISARAQAARAGLDGRSGAAALGAAVLATVLAAAAWLPVPGARVLAAVAVLAACAVVPLARLPRTRDPLELGTAVALVSAVYFGVRALVLLGDDRLVNPLVAEAGTRAHVLAGTAVVAGMLAFAAGYLAVRAEAPAERRRWPRMEAALDRRAGIVMVAVAAPAMVAAAWSARGALEGQAARLGVATGLVAPLAGLGLAGIVLLVVAAARDGRTSTRVILASAVVLLGGIGAVALFKELMLSVVAAVLVAVHYAVRPLGLRALAAVAAVVALAMVPFVSAARHATAEGAGPVRAVAAAPALMATSDLIDWSPQETPATLAPGRYAAQAAALTSRRLSGMDSVVLVVDATPDPHPYLRGETYLGLLAAPVPRALWPGKPELALGRWFTDTYWSPEGGNPSSQAVTLIGEAYVNGGLVVVAVVLGLLGALLRWAYRLTVPSRRYPELAAVYVFVLLGALAVERSLALDVVAFLQRLVGVGLALLVLVVWQRRAGAGASPEVRP